MREMIDSFSRVLCVNRWSAFGIVPSFFLHKVLRLTGFTAISNFCYDFHWRLVSTPFPSNENAKANGIVCRHFKFFFSKNVWKMYGEPEHDNTSHIPVSFSIHNHCENFQK